MSEAPEWPNGHLDIVALESSGWRPTPFREFVLKVHQRCNLSCDYCYVYAMGDQSWRDRPAAMTPEVWQAAARRIAEHARTHGLLRVRVVLHGGEPLLAGPDRLVRMTTDLRAELAPECGLRVGIQTNGVLLDDRALAVLHGAGVAIGISLDGASAHNGRRRRADGRGSHSAVQLALERLTGSPYRSAFAGLLCVVSPDNDPITCYEELLRYRPPTVDFLLPHANWSRPPQRAAGAGPTPYGDWLIAVFDRWYDAPRRETGIRLFEDVINLVLGGTGGSEQVGLSPVAVTVIESDGAIEQVDSLRSAYPGASATGLNVFTDPLDAALRHPGVVARQIGTTALSPACRACPVHRVCGGGHYAHRYRPGTGFANPSVYCADLRRLIEHVQDRVCTDVAALLAGSPS